MATAPPLPPSLSPHCANFRVRDCTGSKILHIGQANFSWHCCGSEGFRALLQKNCFEHKNRKRRVSLKHAQRWLSITGKAQRTGPSNSDAKNSQKAEDCSLERWKALEVAMDDINNSFGKGSVSRLGSAGGAIVETFPSGCLTLDFALGGGLPKGRIVEIFGPESSGKTTLALHAIAEIQRKGGNAMLVDAEHVFDPFYSKALGVDVENLIVCQPDNGEMALESIVSSM